MSRNLVTGTTLHRRLQHVIDRARHGDDRVADAATKAMALDLSRAEARMHERLARRARKAAHRLNGQGAV